MQASRNDRLGFSLVELLVSMAVSSMVMAGVFSVMTSAQRANNSVKQVTSMNNNLRVAMDLLVRDLIQAGQGLPAGMVVTVPSGAGALPIVRPGPVGENYTFDPALPTISAVTVGPGLGPQINGQPTDMITILAADNAFDEVTLTALDDVSMTVSVAVDIDDAPDQDGDNIREGDLLLFEKGSVSTLRFVTGVNGQTVEFDEGDPLNLNQAGAPDGTMVQYLAEAPAEVLNARRPAIAGHPPPHDQLLPGDARRSRTRSATDPPHQRQPADHGRLLHRGLHPVVRPGGRGHQSHGRRDERRRPRRHRATAIRTRAPRRS